MREEQEQEEEVCGGKGWTRGGREIVDDFNYKSWLVLQGDQIIIMTLALLLEA